MSNIDHRLILQISTPKVADKGQEFEIEYWVKNIGNKSFPGRQISVELSWENSMHKVYQRINISNLLAPNQQTKKIIHKQLPLTRGFTWFYVNAVA